MYALLVQAFRFIVLTHTHLPWMASNPRLSVLDRLLTSTGFATIGRAVRDSVVAFATTEESPQDVFTVFEYRHVHRNDWAKLRASAAAWYAIRLAVGTVDRKPTRSRTRMYTGFARLVVKSGQQRHLEVTRRRHLKTFTHQHWGKSQSSPFVHIRTCSFHFHQRKYYGTMLSCCWWPIMQWSCHIQLPLTLHHAMCAFQIIACRQFSPYVLQNDMRWSADVV